MSARQSLRQRCRQNSIPCKHLFGAFISSICKSHPLINIYPPRKEKSEYASPIIIKVSNLEISNFENKYTFCFFLDILFQGSAKIFVIIHFVLKVVCGQSKFCLRGSIV